MCGIFGYIGSGNAVEESIYGLEKLEYRGYDSAGLATIARNEIKIVHSVGRVEKLKQKIVKENLLKADTDIAIAHTRWATHGKATEINCHPHYSGDFVLVHNGIIENYTILKEKLIQEENVKFYSDTDTEVIVKLLDINFQKILKNSQKKAKNIKNIKKNDKNDKKINKLILNSIKNTANQMTGAWAVAFINKKIPEKIFVFKNGSPLIVAANGRCSQIASDINAINDNLENQLKYYSLGDGDICEISSKKTEFHNKNLKKIEIKPSKKAKQINYINNNFKFNMLKEINEIPLAIKNTQKSIINSDYKIFIKKLIDAKMITLIGCGTAYHAGLYGKFIIEKFLKIKTIVELSSEFRYKEQIYCDKEIVIAISQSGETADTIAGLKIAKDNGKTTAVITNVAGSTITQIADYVFCTDAGQEVAVAATKTYIAQLVALNTLIQLVYGGKDVIALDKYAGEVIKKYGDGNIFNKYFDKDKFFFIGRLCDSATALEGALKLKEIAYVHSEGYPAGELKHGTLSLVDNKAVVVAIITQNDIKDKTLNAVHEVKARGANILIVSNIKELKSEGDIITLPELKNYEHLSPILSVIPLQLLAYHYADNKGLNPDMPRNLAKSVTVE